MKNILILSIALAFFFGGFVSAKNQGDLPDAGLTPESPFYFLDKLGEALQEFFTLNPEGKAHLQITFAAERIAEIKVVLEAKGIEAKGLDIAQSRLQVHLAKAAAIVKKEKGKGKDVSTLAQELDEKLKAPKSLLLESFKEQKRELKEQEDQLKTQLKEAHLAGNVAQEEIVAAQLGQVKAQLELLELREEDIEDEIEAEEEKIEEEMEDEDEDSEDATEEKPESLTVTLSAQNNSGESGTATMKREGGKTKVKLDLAAAPSTPQPAHVHTGSCENLGGVKSPLTASVEGESETTLNVSFTQLLSELPLAINVHKSSEEVNVYVACGNIVDR